LPHHPLKTFRKLWLKNAFKPPKNAVLKPFLMQNRSNSRQTQRQSIQPFPASIALQTASKLPQALV
jgi:hypothetical protein